MINVTPVYGFEKPTPDEFFDYELENRNMDRAEGALCALNADLEKSVGTIGAQLSNKATGNPATGAALNAEKVLGTDKVVTLDGTGYVSIPEGADLNDAKYWNFGMYNCDLDIIAATVKNAPFPTAFKLEVSTGRGAGNLYLHQKATEIYTGAVKTRARTGGTDVRQWRETAQIEAGEWAPSFYGKATAGKVTASVIYKQYRKTGKQVSCSLLFTVAAVSGATGTFAIGGLPFPAAEGGFVTSFFICPTTLAGAQLVSATNGGGSEMAIRLSDGTTLAADNAKLISANPWSINFTYTCV